MQKFQEGGRGGSSRGLLFSICLSVIEERQCAVASGVVGWKEGVFKSMHVCVYARVCEGAEGKE